MKKLLFSSAVLLLFACNDKGASGSMSADSEVNKNTSTRDTTGKNGYKTMQSIDQKTAKGMLQNLKKLKVDKDSLAWTTFDVAMLQSAISLPDLKRVRFFVGGKDTTLDGKRITMPAIIMQVQLTNKDLETTFMYFTGIPNICPPPEGTCDMLEQN